MSEHPYQPEAGTEDYVHVSVTQKGGQKLDKPQIELYHPVNYAQVALLKGFTGDILHDPRKAKDKKAAAPAAATVKATSPLETEAQYIARYKELFQEAPAVFLEAEDVKRIVDRAEAKLPDGPEGAKPTESAKPVAKAAAKADKPAFTPIVDTATPNAQS